MSNPFLIVNHHRSGSNFMCRVIKTNKEIRCLNEPLSLHMNFFKEHDLESMNDKQMSRTMNKTERCYLENLREYLLSTPTISGLKETCLFGKMNWITEYISGINVIHIVRNPFAVINSCLKNDIWLQWKYDEMINKYFDKKNSIIQNPLELCVQSWKIRYELFKKEMENKEYLQMRLEDVIFAPEENLGKIMMYIGSDVNNEQIELIKHSYESERGKSYSIYRNKSTILDGWKNNLRGDQIEYIENELHEELQELGYV